MRGDYERTQGAIENNLSKVVILCDTGVFVEKMIKIESDKAKKGLLKIMEFYLVAKLFLLNSLENSDFEEIYVILKKYADAEIKKDSSKNYSKIFNQSDKAWKHLVDNFTK